MIVPRVTEPEWSAWLRTIPTWQAPLKDTVVISPHPDDETLGVGGLTASLRGSGVRVTVIAVTDGEKAYENVYGLGDIRRREQTRALRALGVDSGNVRRLMLPDGGLGPYERALAEMLRPIIRPECHVIAPWKLDFHPDHEVCGRAAEVVAREKHADLSWYFFWTWHRGEKEAMCRLPLVRFTLEPSELTAKHEALSCHRSQLNWQYGDPILPETLLGPTRRPFEVLLPA